MIPVLSLDGGSVTIAGLTVKVGETIEYKPTDSNKIGIGKVEQLKHPTGSGGVVERESVWMKVLDVVSGDPDWVSVSVWHQQYVTGMFNNQKTETKNDDTNQQPAPVQPGGVELW